MGVVGGMVSGLETLATLYVLQSVMSDVVIPVLETAACERRAPPLAGAIQAGVLA